MHRASTKAPLYWLLRAVPGWLVLLGAQVPLLFVDDAPQALVIAGLVVTALIAVAHLAVMPQWRFRVHRWEITDDAAYTQSGWLNQERRLAPLGRVQTVDTQRGPFAQLMGLADVTITTASSRGNITIEALDQSVADQTVAWLTERAQLNSTDGT
jgi:membrane protein YdbS with pleckstrin-like domain